MSFDAEGNCRLDGLVVKYVVGEFVFPPTVRQFGATSDVFVTGETVPNATVLAGQGGGTTAVVQGKKSGMLDAVETSISATVLVGQKAGTTAIFKGHFDAPVAMNARQIDVTVGGQDDNVSDVCKLDTGQSVGLRNMGISPGCHKASKKVFSYPLSIVEDAEGKVALGIPMKKWSA